MLRLVERTTIRQGLEVPQGTVSYTDWAGRSVQQHLETITQVWNEPVKDLQALSAA